MNNSKNLTKLDLEFCKDTKVEISIAVKINGPLDKYNISSGYYNDVCTKATSESGTDIPLNDRRNEFVDNNMSLCEENCILIEYDYAKEKAKCSCDIKTSVPPDYDIKFNKNEFFKSFIDIKNIFNFNIMKCFETVYNMKSLNKNYGFYMIASIVFLHFITLLIFVTISFAKLKEEIITIILTIKFNENPTKDKESNTKNAQIIIVNTKRNQIRNKIDEKEKEGKNISDKKKEKEKHHGRNKKLNLCNCTEKEKINSEKFNCNYKVKVMDNINMEKSENTKKSDDKIEINDNMEKSDDIFNKKEILDKKDFELKSLEYNEALELDHRNLCEYYISSIKYNHPFLFSFGSYNDYNSKIIKIFLFFFSFCLDFTINALFFTDDTMHKIYIDKGKFDFLFQIPQILYSTIISRFIDSLIKNFSFTQDNIVELKQIRTIKRIQFQRKKVLLAIKIKFIIFFVLSFLFLILCWYYITCFCGIYINTQTHLFKDTFISLVISLSIPFALYLITGIFRISSLRAKKQNLKYLYKFSLFLDDYFT